MANEKILIIDESQRMRETICKIVASQGYVPIAAADGRAGMDLVGTEKPDLIITEMLTSGQSGVQLLDELAQRQVDIPVVIMTAGGSVEFAIEAFRRGVKDYILKPPTVEDVQKVIGRALADRRLRREKDTLAGSLAATNQLLEKRLQEMAVLGRVGQAVAALQDPQVLMRRVVEAAVYVCGASRGALLLSENGILRMKTATGFATPIEGTAADAGSTVAGVYKHNQAVRLAGAQIAREPYGREAPSPAAFLAAPIVAQDQALGVLAVDRAQPGRPFSENDAHLLAAISDYAAISLQNVRLYAESRAAQDMLQAVIRSSADGVIVLNAAGQVVLANPAASELLDHDLPPERPLPHTAAGSALGQLLSRMRAQDKPLTQELDGAQGKALSVTVSPAPQVGAVAVLHDITMLKEMERFRHQNEQREIEQLRATYDRYVPPKVTDHLVLTGNDGVTAPEVREVVALYASMRGFDALFHLLMPDALVQNVLNRHLSIMSEIILRHGGTVDKFMGDSILAIFGWPTANPDDATRAIICAMEMQGAFGRLRAEWEESLNIQVSLAAGIGQGMVIAGNIGTPQHQDYTVVGDAVNIAHQLSDQAHGGEVLMSRAALDRLSALPEAISFDDFPPVRLRGQSEEHEIVLLHADLGAASTRLLGATPP